MEEEIKSNMSCEISYENGEDKSMGSRDDSPVVFPVNICI